MNEITKNILSRVRDGHSVFDGGAGNFSMADVLIAILINQVSIEEKLDRFTGGTNERDN